MKRILVLLMMLAMSGCLRAGEGMDRIGLYLDELGTVNCLSDHADSVFQIPAYLIVHDISALGGLIGWEASIAWDGGLSVWLEGLTGNAINAGQFPNFLVGLPEAIPAHSPLLLATFNIRSLSPGRVFIKGASTPSLPGSPYPIYADGADPNILHSLLYAYGSPVDPVVTIGLEECPEEFDQPPLSFLDDLNPISMPTYDEGDSKSPKAGGAWDLHFSRFSPLTAQSLFQLIVASDLIFDGIVLDYENICTPGISERSPPHSHVVLQVHVVEVMKGFCADREVEVLLQYFNNENCATYLSSLHPETVEPAKRYLFLCRHVDDMNALICPMAGMFCYDNDILSICNDNIEFEQEDFRAKFETILWESSVQGQYDRADIVVTVTDIGIPDFRQGQTIYDTACKATVLNVVKGQYINPTITFMCFNDRNPEKDLAPPRTTPNDTAILFLELDGSTYYLIYGRRSYFLTDGVKIYFDNNIFTGATHAIFESP